MFQKLGVYVKINVIAWKLVQLAYEYHCFTTPGKDSVCNNGEISTEKSLFWLLVFYLPSPADLHCPNPIYVSIVMERLVCGFWVLKMWCIINSSSPSSKSRRWKKWKDFVAFGIFFGLASSLRGRLQFACVKWSQIAQYGFWKPKRSSFSAVFPSFKLSKKFLSYRLRCLWFLEASIRRRAPTVAYCSSKRDYAFCCGFSYRFRDIVRHFQTPRSPSVRGVLVRFYFGWTTGTKVLPQRMSSINRNFLEVSVLPTNFESFHYLVSSCSNGHPRF